MNSFLRYFAKGVYNSTGELKNELEALLRKKVRQNQRTDSYEFRANFHEMLRVCFHSRLIESLHVQVGNIFEATDERQLMQGLQRTPFSNFWKTDPNKLPKVKVYVERSALQERHVKRIVEEYVHRLPVMRVFNSLQLQAKGLASLSEVQEIVNKQVRKERETKKLQIAANTDSTSLENKTGEIVETDDPEQVSFIFDMRKNIARLYTPVNRQPMYKHGWKRRVGWGPIKESLAAAILTRTGIIDQAKKDGQLALWDPFCGCGTFLLEALSMLNDMPVREDTTKNFSFASWPCFKPEFLEIYLAEENKKQKQPFPAKILGSDISLQAINYTIENYRKMNIDATQQSNEFLRRDPASNIFYAAPNTFFVAEDFQKVGKELLLSPEKFSVIANLPYGLRSKETIESQQLSSIYRRFSQLVEEYQNTFENVFVVVPYEDKYDRKHFLGVSKLRWTLLETYFSGGVKIGLYGLRDPRHQNQLIPRSEMQLLQANTQLVKPQIERPVMPVVMARLPKHLIPKKPRIARLRVLWKKKVHALRLAYRRHMDRRLSIQNVRDFRANVLRHRLEQRGKSWRKQNLSLLGNAPEEFEDDIRKAFEKRIVTAMERKDKQREAKQAKKDRRNKKVVRKW